MNKEELIQFEKDVKQMFLDGKLRSPIHLSGGNEEQLIRIFKGIEHNDWIFTNYRSHYHALLKGVPKDTLKKWILDNKSIHFMDKKHKIFSSAIVGGTLPIALGVAKAIKMKGGKERVFVFFGDMTATTGVFKDCWAYALFNNLPITFVIEDNGMSTDTKTLDAWGTFHDIVGVYNGLANVIYYKYKRTYPHYGVGEFVNFK